MTKMSFNPPQFYRMARSDVTQAVEKPFDINGSLAEIIKRWQKMFYKQKCAFSRP